MRKQSERRRALLQTINAINTIAHHHFIKTVEDDARRGVFHRRIGVQANADAKLRCLAATICEVLTGRPLVHWEAMYPGGGIGPFDDDDLETYAECYFAAVVAIKSGTRGRIELENSLRPTYGGAIDQAKYTIGSAA